MEILKNDKLTVEVSSHGAELQSIKNAEGHEYLWQGDEKYWPRRSPLLFPIVCGLWKDEYRVDGKTYSLPRHGFARDMDFVVLDKTETSVTYGLDANEETLKVYPYEFHLNVRYVLKEDTVNVFWIVKNTGKEEMHFQVGGHPAFNLPDVAEGYSTLEKEMAVIPHSISPEWLRATRCTAQSCLTTTRRSPASSVTPADVSSPRDLR